MTKFQFKSQLKSGYPGSTARIVFLNKAAGKNLIESFSADHNLALPETLKPRLFIEDFSEIMFYPADGKPDLVIIGKYTTDKKFSNDYFRNYLAGVAGRLNKEKIKNIYLTFPDYNGLEEYFSDEEHLKLSCLEGLMLGTYSFEKYKSEKQKDNSFIIHLTGDKKSLKRLTDKAEAAIEGVFYARDLANEPSGVLTPDAFGRKLKKDLLSYSIKTEIWNEKEILKNRMNGVIAVGKGSAEPPRFIILRYKPPQSKLKLCLVGKGVTFDSGGISIKPHAGMSEMKADMSGGAAVAGTILCAAKLKIPVEITGLIPAVENMPSGSSFKPGDIIISRSGQTIEIDNTDAEGRLILADALDYAKEQKPDVIIDLATLTGSVVVALGMSTAGLFSNNDELAEQLYSAGLASFERVWRMPMWDEYNELIKSDVADMINLGGRWGGSIFAAKFLQKFTDDKIPWAHLDIAGPTSPHDFTNYTSKYMTGFGVRLLVEYLFMLASRD